MPEFRAVQGEKTMTRYGEIVNPRVTSQSEQAREDQVKNRAGGYVWQVDCWTSLDRFLILGAEGSTYYVGEKKLVKENAKAIGECLKQDGIRTVKRIAEISQAGRAVKNDPAVFCLAMAAGHSDNEVRKAALQALPKVCRIGTDLFNFAADVENFRRWGRALRNAVANWYLDKPADKLALQLVKYQQRNGWSHKDLLKLSHANPFELVRRDPEMDSGAYQALFRWVTQDGSLEAREVLRKGQKKDSRMDSYEELNREALPKLVHGFEAVQLAESKAEVIKLIHEYWLSHEMLPTQWKKEPEIWEALLDRGLPMTALTRNLGVMTACGLIKPMSAASKKVAEQFANEEAIRKSRLHPMKILIAMKQYQSGHGDKGKLSWSPVTQVIDAMDSAFYTAFKSVQPTGKNYLLALDVSGSMGSAIQGCGTLTCREAAAAMAMVTAKLEQNWQVIGFTCESGGGWGWGSRNNSSSDPDSGVTVLNISPKMRLDQVCEVTARQDFGGTDCSQPMLYALKHKIEVDTFMVYTDNETWAGRMQPFQALRKYRQEMGRQARLIVCGLTSDKFTIADPRDPGMLDICGMDTSVPDLISSFSKGEF